MTNELANGFNRIIECYSIDDYFIHVKYTDGKTDLYDYLQCNIEKITDEMIEQAKKIIKYKTSNEYKTVKRIQMVESCLTALAFAIVCSMGVEMSFENINEKRVLVELIVCLAAPVIIYLAVKFKEKFDKLEIEKYKKFLENYDLLKENSLNEEMYKNIEKKGQISINNIDRYSYDEICEMLKNIQNVRKRTNI